MVSRAGSTRTGPRWTQRRRRAGDSDSHTRYVDAGARFGQAAVVSGVLVAGGLLVAASAVSAAGPPPGRAYELVSPPDHLQGAVPGMSTDLQATPARSSEDGDSLIFGAGSTMGENWSGPSNPMIFGRRTDRGWEVRSAIRSLDEGNTPVQLGQHEAQSGWLSDNGQEFVFGSIDLGSGASGGLLSGIYRSKNALLAPDWLSRPVGSPVPGVITSAVATGNDTQTVALQSTSPLTADAPAAPTSAVYVSRNGQLELISRAPDGSVLTQSSYLANSSSQGHNAASAPSISMRNQVAGNGRYVLFLGSGNANGGSLYVRDLEAGVTRQLAGGGTGAPETTVGLREGWGGVGGSSAMSFDPRTVPQGTVFAARDAPRAFFHPGAGVGQTPFVYEANLETGAVVARTAINGAPMGLSPDGQRMLFLELPAGAGNGATSPPGSWKLRYWDAANPGASVAVATISLPSGVVAESAAARVYRSSADGKTWIFTSQGSLDSARPNATPTTQQLYRWTVGDSEPRCLTCQPTDGVSRTAGVSLTVQENIRSEGPIAPTTPIVVNTNAAKTRIAQPGHSVSSDGRWLLFDSPDRLVPEDTNDVRDVYLWDRDGGPGGELQLVSSGNGTSPSYALDLDPTGRSAFFSTRDGLVPADDDSSYDVYVARIGGGFPDDSPQSCVGEACRPPVIPDPPHDLIASSVLREAPAGPKQSVQRGTPKLRIRSVRTSSQRLTVRVDTPKAGKIRVSGKQLRTTNRTAKRATTYTLRVPLSASAKRQVARGKTVKVKVQVRFTPSGSKKASTVSSSVSVKKGR